MKNDEWISVEDNLPEHGTKVLTAGSAIGITCSFYWGTNEKKIPHPACNGWSIMDITHWMPLPLLPNGQPDKYTY